MNEKEKLVNGIIYIIVLFIIVGFIKCKGNEYNTKAIRDTEQGIENELELDRQQISEIRVQLDRERERIVEFEKQVAEFGKTN